MSRRSKGTVIGFWIATALFCLQAPLIGASWSAGVSPADVRATSPGGGGSVIRQ